jgi:hypothetical protein
LPRTQNPLEQIGKKRKPWRDRKTHTSHHPKSNLPPSASRIHAPAPAPSSVAIPASTAPHRTVSAAMRRFAADRARRAVAASLHGAASRSVAPSPHAPAPRHPASPVGAAAMAAAMVRTMSTTAAGTPPVSVATINPKVPLLCPLLSDSSV